MCLEKIIFGGSIIGGLFSGALVGYTKAKGIDLQSDALTCSLTYGPTIIGAGTGTYAGLLLSEFGGNPVGTTVYGGLVGSIIGAASTALGYCIGHTLG